MLIWNADFFFWSFPHCIALQNDGAGQTTQINIGAGNNYGATGNVSTNPFAASAATMVTENVQPEARDMYMHGAPEDRSY